MQEKDLNIFKRFWIYQKERFPFFAYGLMVFTFAFSAMSYSKILRNDYNFSPKTYILGALISFGFFFLLRLFDEFKDAKEDAQFRPYRAVPRGLVSFLELKILICIIIVSQAIINIFFLPKMLWIWILVICFMLVMAKEFFIRDWLKKHPIAYLISHMMVMPVFDFYTTGLDWNMSGNWLPKGLVFFLVVTFLNGVVIEIGRKIRAKEAEEVGVETYSFLWGEKKSTIIWLLILFTTFIFANIACYFAGFGNLTFAFLTVFMLLCSIPAFMFLKTRKQKYASKLETMAGIWTLGMYLSLGGIPMIIHFIRSFNGL